MKRRRFIEVSLLALPLSSRAQPLRPNGSQRVVAIAGLSDGTFWSDMVRI